MHVPVLPIVNQVIARFSAVGPLHLCGQINQEIKHQLRIVMVIIRCTYSSFLKEPLCSLTKQLNII